MTAILLVILSFILVYIVYQGKVGYFACISFIFFGILTALFYATSPALFALNAVIHVSAFAILLVWQFYYYSWKNVYEYLKSPIILSVLIMSVIMLLYNDISPYYHTYKATIDQAQFNYFSHTVFPFLILPLAVPDRYTREEMVASIPFWGIIYVIVFFSSFSISSEIISDRGVLGESTDGTIGNIALSRIIAVVIIVFFMRIIASGGKQKYENPCLIFGCSLFFLFLLIVGQRGTLIGVGIALLSLFLRKEWRRNSFLIAGVGLFVFLISATFIDFGQFQIFQRFSQFQNIESFERYHDYGKTWEIFKENDFLWGLGSKGYFFRTGRPWPHNIVLEHISDYGVAGLLCITVLLVFCCRYTITLIRHSNNATDLSIACCWIALCFSAMVSSSILSHQLFYILSGLLVLTYQDYQRQLSSDTPE